VRLLVAVVFAFIAVAAVTIGVLAVAGAPPSAYYWPPLVVGVTGVVLCLGWAMIWRDVGALAVLLADLVAFVAIAVAQHNTRAGAVILAVFAAWALVWLPNVTRSRRFTTEIRISRDRAFVFAFVTDMRNLPRYALGVTSVEKLTDGPVGVGTQFGVTMRSGTIVFRELDKVVAYEPPERFAWHDVHEGGSGTETMTMSDDGGSTRLTYEVISMESYALALVGMALVNPLLKLAGSRERRGNLARLKRTLEKGADA
jgi:uncharacterized protein YndB with AHSA1/START domain